MIEKRFNRGYVCMQHPKAVPPQKLGQNRVLKHATEARY